MHHEAKAQQKSSVDVLQQISVAAYPQLCGSWPGGEWPENEPRRLAGASVDLCSGSLVAPAGEIEVRGKMG